MTRSIAKRPTLALISALAAAFALAGPVEAQSSKAHGLVVGGHVQGSSIVIEDSDRSNGAGGGVMLGYGFANGLAVFGQYDVANVDVRNQPEVAGSWTHAHMDLGVRYHFQRPAKSVVPYVAAAGSIRDVTVTDLALTNPIANDKIELTGQAVTVGGGVMLYPTEHFAFDIGLLFAWGKYDEATLDGVDAALTDALSSQSTRFNMGVTWWP
jgi:hypothetical protein